MSNHAGAAGTVVDDDPVTTQVFDGFRQQPCADVHATTVRIHNGEFNWLSRKVFWLQFCEFCLRVALRPGRRGKKSNDQGVSNPGPFHDSPPSFLVRRRNIRYVSTALAASSTAATGRFARIIAPSGDMTRDCRSDCSRRGASTKAMTNGARSYSSLRST